MTPQTLVNDLASGICDPLDVILIVVGPLLKIPSLLLVYSFGFQTRPTKLLVTMLTPKSFDS